MNDFIIWQCYWAIETEHAENMESALHGRRTFSVLRLSIHTAKCILFTFALSIS